VNRNLTLFAGCLWLLVACAAKAQEGPQGADVPAPDQLQVVRWHVVINQTAADAFKQIANGADSNSVVFQAYTAEGAALRNVVADAIGRGNVVQVGDDMTFAYPRMDGTLFMDTLRLDASLGSAGHNEPGINIEPADDRGNETFSLLGDNRLKAAISQSAQIWLHTSNGIVNGPAGTSVQFEGEINCGECIAFLAPFMFPPGDVYYQLIAFESFKASNPSLKFMRNELNSGWWCQNGPEKLRKWGGDAVLWEEEAGHKAEDVPADFAKPMDDGKVLKLVGLSRQDVAPWCWWDGDGIKIAGAPLMRPEDRDIYSFLHGNPAKGLLAEFELDGTLKEQRLRSPATRPLQGKFTIAPDSPYIQYGFTVLDDNAGNVKVGALVGDWREVGQLKPGDSKIVDGITFTLNGPRNRLAWNGETFVVQFIQSADSDDVFTISAVGPDGSEATGGEFQQPFDFGNRRKSPIARWISFRGVSLNNVQYFRLCERKRQYVTFSGFATASGN